MRLLYRLARKFESPSFNPSLQRSSYFAAVTPAKAVMLGYGYETALYTTVFDYWLRADLSVTEAKKIWPYADDSEHPQRWAKNIASKRNYWIN